VHADGATVIREGHGTGEGRGTSPGEVHDIALKAAETDATKRALATFGRPFGLGLYRGGRAASSQKPCPHHLRYRPLFRCQPMSVSVFIRTIRPLFHRRLGGRYGAGLVLSFTLNRNWTFQHAGRIAPAAIKFAAVFVVAYLINLATVLVLIHNAGINAFVAQASGIPPYTALFYLGSRYIAFPKAKPSL
jgi:hypothetical protein